MLKPLPSVQHFFYTYQRHTCVSEYNFSVTWALNIRYLYQTSSSLTSQASDSLHLHHKSDSRPLTPFLSQREQRRQALLFGQVSPIYRFLPVFLQQLVAAGKVATSEETSVGRKWRRVCRREQVVALLRGMKTETDSSSQTPRQVTQSKLCAV
jgi:glycine/D-amino acid oxidase-like deaminating enzyme